MTTASLSKLTILAIPDLHCPFNHKDAFDFLQAIKKRYKPDEVVCLGDELDAHALSDYTTDPDGYSAGQELEAGMVEMRKLYKIFPDVKVCTSNHGARPFRKAYKHGIPRAYLRDYKEFMDAPKGWVWRDSWEIDGVIFEHGEGFSGAQGALKSALANMQSTVIGHLHSFAGIQWSANPKHLIFGFNAGCLIDRDSYAFAYGAKMKSKPILGCGIISKGVPTFIPMLLNMKGDWVGNV